MIGECCKANTGILFKEAGLRDLVTDNPKEADRLDAGSDIHDQLKSNKPWWVLESVPMRKRVQHPDKVTLT